MERVAGVCSAATIGDCEYQKCIVTLAITPHNTHTAQWAGCFPTLNFNVFTHKSFEPEDAARKWGRGLALSGSAWCRVNRASNTKVREYFRITKKALTMAFSWLITGKTV